MSSFNLLLSETTSIEYPLDIFTSTFRPMSYRESHWRGKKYSSREKEVRSVEAISYTISPPLSLARVRYAEHTSAFSFPTSSFPLHPSPGYPLCARPTTMPFCHRDATL